MKTYTLVILTLSLVGNLMAAEADNFSKRSEKDKMVDVSSVVNDQANLYLAQGVATFNSTEKCDESVESETKLYSILQKYFANHSKGELSKFVIYGDNVAKTIIPLKNSVYQNWSFNSGYFLSRRNAAESSIALASLIKIGDIMVGTDKLEHMFGMGHKYFKGYYLQNKSMTKVFKNAVFLEKTALGGMFLATGVFSYGDLSANFNGMRFWNHMLQKRDDILGKDYNIGPYVKCDNGEYKIVKPIDFRAYIDPSMDESINCSKFATKAGLSKFQNSLERLNMHCPMDPELNKKMQDKYDIPLPEGKLSISDWIINKGSNDDVSYLNEFDE